MMFLPLMALLLFSFSFSAYLIQFKTKMRSSCIQESISFQKKLIQNEESLFKLNPLALILRQQLILKEALLLAALAAENIPLIAKLKIEISEIRRQQKNLDQLQKKIIQKAQLQMQTQRLAIEFQLNQISQNTNLIWKYYIQSFTSIKILKRSHLSIQADSSDLAPVYDLTDDYIEQQKLAYSWQHFYETARSNQQFIKEKNEIEMSCGASAKKQGARWNILINADKF